MQNQWGNRAVEGHKLVYRCNCAKENVLSRSRNALHLKGSYNGHFPQVDIIL